MSHKEVVYTRHHRRPRALQGSDQDWNITMLPENAHRAWHTLFGAMSVHEICRELNEKYADPEFKFRVTRRKS